MKGSYDDICKQLNDSKQTINSIKIQFENTKQTNQLNIDSMKRQFQRENDNLNDEIKKLSKLNDELKEKLNNNSNKKSSSTSPPPHNHKMGPLYNTKEVNNPYLDLSSPTITAAVPPPGTSSYGSHTLSNYVQELQEKKSNDEDNFANKV